MANGDTTLCLERYRLILRHEILIEGKDGTMKTATIDDPITVQCVIDRKYGTTSMVINELLERLREHVLRLHTEEEGER